MAGTNDKGRKSGLRAGAIIAAMISTIAVAGVAVSAVNTAADTSGGKMYLLSESQYRQVISDTFGPDIEFTGRFKHEDRTGGLLTISNGTTSVSDVQLQSFDDMARQISGQVTDPEHRSTLIPCRPASEKASDSACAAKFLSSAGRLLFRRPLTETELKLQVSAADTGANQLGSFYDGLSISLADMLVAPEFLFRIETTRADQAGGRTLDDYSRAARLSFFLWNTQPDDELLRAASKGELSTPEGVSAQVERMIASRRFESGVRAFFIDMLHFDEFADLQKDGAIYPRFTSNVARDAEEQTLKTLVDLLVTRKGDYRDIFTTRRTFLTPSLAAVYNVPLPSATAPMELGSWQAVELPEGDPRAGLLTQIGFTALHSHPGRSSPTVRGRAIREAFMCQLVPNPPPNINFAAVADTGNPMFKTARDRLTAHRDNPTCATCHKMMDPLGLSLEDFDGAGSFRTTENGALIDTVGDLNGATFKNAVELGKVMHDQSAVTNCVARRAVDYGLGRQAAAPERPWLAAVTKTFEQHNYRIADLFRTIATSPEFYRTLSVAPKLDVASQ
jgi:hypothetical protein